MGGVLAVYSEPNVGTCCAAYLPQAAGAAAPPTPQGPHLTPQGGRKGLLASVLRRWFGAGS